MPQAKMGSRVKLHYISKPKNDTELSSSANNEFLEFCIGEGKVLSDLEQAVIGMSTGESKTIAIPAKQVDSSSNRESTIVIDRQSLPANTSIEVGQKVYVRVPNVHASIPVIVQEISESNIVLSMNHSFEHENLIFNIQLVEVN